MVNFNEKTRLYLRYGRRDLSRRNNSAGCERVCGLVVSRRQKVSLLTNASNRSPKELQQRLHRMGLDVDEVSFYTSALATAQFIANQMPGATAYIIGDRDFTTRCMTPASPQMKLTRTMWSSVKRSTTILKRSKKPCATSTTVRVWSPPTPT